MTSAELLLIEARTHGRVLRRRGTPPIAGTLVGFHGYGEHAAIQLERLAAIPGTAGWHLLSIQGLHRFYRNRSEESVAGWMTREDRLSAIDDNIAYVDAALDAAFPDGPGSLVLAGFSQGVAMAFRAAVRGRQPADAVIAVGGDVPPELFEDRSTRFPRVLLLRGHADEWYTQEKMDADVAALTSRGVDVRAGVLTGAHEWTLAVADVVADFLAGA